MSWRHSYVPNYKKKSKTWTSITQVQMLRLCFSFLFRSFGRTLPLSQLPALQDSSHEVLLRIHNGTRNAENTKGAAQSTLPRQPPGGGEIFSPPPWPFRVAGRGTRPTSDPHALKTFRETTQVSNFHFLRQFFPYLGKSWQTSAI